jgi:Cu-Zn family superoxide dismutase
VLAGAQACHGQHGMHVHQLADCSGKDGMAAGGHFNPTQAPHGAVEDAKSHLGDLGNIEADAQGRATVHVIKKGASLSAAADSLMGHSLIIHGGADDLKSQPAGNSGARVACGVIAPGNR